MTWRKKKSKAAEFFRWRGDRIVIRVKRRRCCP